MHMSPILFGHATLNYAVCHLFTDSSQIQQLPHLYLLFSWQKLPQKKPSHSLQLIHHSFHTRPTHNKSTLGDHFSSVASSLWNSIPNGVRCTHHCHHLSLLEDNLVLINLQALNISFWSLYTCAWLGYVINFFQFCLLKNALMCVKNSNVLQRFDCLLILILMLIYACLFCPWFVHCWYLSNASCFHALSLGLWHSLLILIGVLHHIQRFLISLFS